ncbi:hypothetical protein APUTEX25_000826 [Auxenochlorella protothecoides]|uniref:AAA+ ATPase domain-containing protein n=1 Tax=Auxenochlorella protothecoides TaxID=3075 RepID=A0A3M7KQR6_AUXPR|nr:hypothetical protein APUTEX25_000826 [Auxenochlorella protothecoides]|eukprot:RMZ52707.1 hypothetical protein APUTEX25_000826 [Auxenochlorella protothecoides]
MPSLSPEAKRGRWVPDGGAASSLTTFTEGELDDDELLRLAAERLPESQIAPGLHDVTASELQMLGDCTPASQPDFEAEAQELLADAGIDATEAAATLELAAGRKPVHGPEGEENLIPLRPHIPPSLNALDVPGQVMPVTDGSGKRAYCSLEDVQNTGQGRAALQARSGTLLARPYSLLLQDIEAGRVERARRASVSGRGGAAPAARRAGPAQKPRTLWADKYAPTAFMDLLSAEQINSRDVVRWLKEWDACVFGRAVPPAPAARSGANSMGPAAAPDPLGRPQHKIILLAGPPGLGKTTLAHVAAVHCGYRPLEINASDDRSAGALGPRVAAAATMRSVLADRRPNCIVVDEIDGALGGAEGAGAIAALLRIVQAPPVARAGRGLVPGAGAAGSRSSHEAADAASSDGESDGEEHPAPAGPEKRPKGRGKAPGPLLRPIIAICNDLYCPALRPLRDVARVFHFRKPTTERLAQRLAYLCACEGLRCEKSTLRTLAEMAECDVRSCLNTLQFLASRQTHVRLQDLKGLSLGQKDVTKGAFTVWQDLLQHKPPAAIAGRASEAPAARQSRLLTLLQDFGEHDLVLSGVHENLLSLRYFDLACSRTAWALFALCDADRLLGSCYASGSWGAARYVPAALLSAAGEVTSVERPAMVWPKSGADARRKQAGQAALLRAWRCAMSPLGAACHAPRSLVLDIAPMLGRVTAPPLRPVGLRLFSSAESAALNQVVALMLALGLKPAPQVEDDEDENADGEEREAHQGLASSSGRPRQAHTLRFQPPVHSLARFRGQAAACPVPSCHPATWQTLQQALDMEAIRRAEAGRLDAGDKGSARSDAVAASREDTPPGLGPGPTRHVVPLTLAERLQLAKTAPSAALKPQRSMSWLDGLKERKRPMGRQTVGGKDGAAPHSVLYCFHEGYTNAVRRPVRMAHLL